MSVEVKLRPITRWPGTMRKDHQRRRSQFDSTYIATKRLLQREAAQLGARQVVVQLGIDEDDLRIDGDLRANAQPKHPGVVVSIDSKHGPLTYATDRFHGWQHNLRAIALGLEALRKVDRYGIAESGEQYVGWRAIGSGGSIAAPAAMTVEAAARLLSEHAIESPLSGRSVVSVADLLDDPPERRRSALKLAYRLGSHRLHPDQGGDPDEFRRLTEARALLLEHCQ